MRDLNKLSKEIYRANKAKGFHEEKHSADHMLCLVISELMEAVEADRKGCRADMEHYVDILGSPAHKNGISDDDWFHLFQHTIKDSVEDELADAVIRLLDTAGALDVVIDEDFIKKCFNAPNSEWLNLSSFTEKMFTLCGVLFESEMDSTRCITNTISALLIICKNIGVDIWTHIDMKLRYNGLRPYKHGKKY